MRVPGLLHEGWVQGFGVWGEARGIAGSRDRGEPGGGFPVHGFRRGCRSTFSEAVRASGNHHGPNGRLASTSKALDP
jgi:hypothetical protein